MKEKILVVGASGLVGQSLVHILEANNYRIIELINQHITQTIYISN